MKLWFLVALIIVIVYLLVTLWIWKISDDEDKKALKLKGILIGSGFFSLFFLIPIFAVGILYFLAILGSNYLFAGSFSGNWKELLSLAFYLSFILLINSLFDAPIKHIVNRLVPLKLQPYLILPISIMMNALVIHFVFTFMSDIKPKSFLSSLFLAGVLVVIDLCGSKLLDNKIKNKKNEKSSK
ncbi:hypothetical protein [Baia soyae]|uniref:Uncharacterized protein n=1 Tax=Baia soyae TaxID=1544746 RepID=A0A4R2RG62_9BACL|nr:hypothetical protein [Baia soyae]TCP62652.1 hypothetical protein EDD57_15219 [Baia soyae]